MRVAVLGTGALGCLFAARLAPHARVQVLGTWTEGLAAIRAGIRVEGEGVVPVAAFDDPARADPADLALILVKSYQTPRAARWAAQVLAPDGLALTLQNGLGNREVLAALLGEGRAWAGATTQGATLLGPGWVRPAGRGEIWLPADRALDRTADLFARAGWSLHRPADVDGVVWGKLVVNAAINPVAALARRPNGALWADPDLRAVMAAAAREAAAVARAAGVRLPFDDPVARVEEVCRATAPNRASTLQDLERGRPTEIDALSGAVVREGRRLGVSTPVNEVLWRLVRALGPPPSEES